MTNSQLFKKAHEMTRATVRDGDNYQATFGACLKIIKAQSERKVDFLEVVGSALNSFAIMLVVTFMLVLVGSLFGNMLGYALVGAIVAAVVGAIATIVFVIDDVKFTIMLTN
ncbi:MAG: hypothetical protein CMH22_05080 [Methylophaga sp.]|nr:hypothetical protein [Methylophaga sp.]MAX51330.1 hypothetical protein [Methylophaga sp.]|tara:strand:+ start:29225 stop:29560 length:336 start_codon:yes stop_codon:yes gene_type:complete